MSTLIDVKLGQVLLSLIEDKIDDKANRKWMDRSSSNVKGQVYKYVLNNNPPYYLNTDS